MKKQIFKLEMNRNTLINQEYVFKCFVRLHVAHFQQWYTEALMSGNRRKIDFLDWLIYDFKDVAVCVYKHVVNHDDDTLIDFVIAQKFMIRYFVENYYMYCDMNGHLMYDDSSIYFFTNGLVTL